jgi:hypothetical protein
LGAIGLKLLQNAAKSKQNVHKKGRPQRFWFAAAGPVWRYLAV